MDLTTRLFLGAIVLLSSVSTVLVFAEVAGLLPDRLTRFFARKRAAAAIEVLCQLGVDVDRLRGRNLAEAVPDLAPGDYTTCDHYSPHRGCRKDGVVRVS